MREQRKTVTIVFADVVGSTALASERDPEVVRALMARYLERVSDVTRAHGGTLEKFAGDAAMIIFGVPTVHDDDAERAVRAALEIRDGAANLPVRVGVNTGEAVTAARDDRQFMVSGDAVNVAARLQQGADSGEVLVGSLTEQLTRNTIEYEPHELVDAKGKADPIIAFRALRARSQTPVQARGIHGLQSPLVGRSRELRILLDTYERAAEDRRVHLFTLVGAAGVGKSRLVSEALSILGGSGARLVRGRCLPYGRGITYWPLAEILREGTGITLSDEREAALAKLDRWLGELLVGDPQRQAVRARLAVMMAFETPEKAMPDTPPERVAREIAWAARHYLEALARGAPLVVVVDDLHSAEEAITDLVENLAERSVDVPMLIIAIARPEFLEAHRGWGSGKANSTTITLDPLSPQEAGSLISHILEIDNISTQLRTQIVERSAGMPLFCEEFLRMLIDEGRIVRDSSGWTVDGPIDEINVPHTVQAVLAARLDGLPDREKHVMQAASVIGERFEPHQVRELMGGADPEVSLDSLRHRGLVVGGDGPHEEIRFKHLLVRDAAYASLPKSERALLHDRAGLVIQAEAGDPHQVAEILAHHAERAFTLSSELALEGEAMVRRAQRALDWSLVMGDTAATRRDRPTVDSALLTATAAMGVLPGGGGSAAGARVAMLLTESRLMVADYAGAASAASQASTLGAEAGLVEVVARARLAQAWIIVSSSSSPSYEDLVAAVESAVEACHEAGDIRGEIEARHIGTIHLYGTGRLAESIEVNERLLKEAREIKDSALTANILLRLATTEQLRGNRGKADIHLTEAEALSADSGLRNVSMQALLTRGIQLFMAGEMPAAEAVFRDYMATAEDAGAAQSEISGLRFLSYALLNENRPAEAAEALDRAIVLSEASGERYNRTELFAIRSRASLDLGDLESAEAFIKKALEWLREGDVTAVSEVHHQLGLLRMAQGRMADAEGSLRRSLAAVINTDYNWPKTNAALALARHLANHGATPEASKLVADREAWIFEHKIPLWDSEIEEMHGLLAKAGHS